MYLQDSPYQRLRIEVDSVAGCLPDQKHLDALRDFVDAQCSKPGSVELLVDDEIPRELPAERQHGRPIHAADRVSAWILKMPYGHWSQFWRRN